MINKPTITEKQLHAQICKYIKLQYPRVIFNTDLSGIRLTFGQAKQVKNLRSGNGFPDIVIYKKYIEHIEIKKGVHSVTTYSALFLEVKKECPFKLNGALKDNEHLREQYEMHERLKDAGYYACFVWTFEQSKSIIDKYLNHG